MWISSICWRLKFVPFLNCSQRPQKIIPRALEPHAPEAPTGLMKIVKQKNASEILLIDNTPKDFCFCFFVRLAS